VIIPNSVSFTREIMLPLPPGAFCGYPQGGSIQPSSVLARWTPMDPETCGTSPGNRVADQSRPLHSSPHLKNRRSPSPDKRKVEERSAKQGKEKEQAPTPSSLNSPCFGPLPPPIGRVPIRSVKPEEAMQVDRENLTKQPSYTIGNTKPGHCSSGPRILFSFPRRRDIPWIPVITSWPAVPLLKGQLTLPWMHDCSVVFPHFTVTVST
jgi:hypothetical protein